MDSISPKSSTVLRTSNRPTYSCIRCSDRKVKCDRQKPCSACVKQNVECQFRQNEPARKKQKRLQAQVLQERVRRYEELLKEQGIDPGAIPDESQPEFGDGSSVAKTPADINAQLPTPFSISSEPDRSITRTQLFHDQDRSKFVDNSLWSRVVEELHDADEILEEDSNGSSDVEGQVHIPSHLLFNVALKSGIESTLASSDQILQLWHIFVDNVDPLTKLIHAPSLQPAIQKASLNLKSVSTGFQALVFSVCSAALMSLSADECAKRFRQPRKYLLKSYITATSSALSQANFMATTSLIVLQALTLHILSIRDTFEPRTVWILNGVAIRIAEGMGVHREGSTLGLPPFETEIRRRLWWFLKMFDARAAELCGLPKFRATNSETNLPHLPTNVNDEELYPGMTSCPTSSIQPTDMLFCAVRAEMASFITRQMGSIKQQGPDGTWWYEGTSASDTTQKQDFIKGIEETLETNYLRYCDPSKPLHLMTMVGARSAVNVGNFLAHHPRKWSAQDQIPESERKYVWDISINLLEQHTMIQTNSLLKNFAWHARYYLQWHSFIHVLDTLRTEPLMAGAEKAWSLVESVYENNSDMITDIKRPIYVAVGSLCLRAFDSREAAVTNADRQPDVPPVFIVKLRHRLEAAKRKREAQTSMSKRDRTGHPQYGHISETMANSAVGSLPAYRDGQNTDKNPFFEINQGQANPQSNAETFWLAGDYEEMLSANPIDMMDMDAAFLQNEGLGTEQPAKETINWTQWDAWLRDSTFPTNFGDAVL